VKSLYRHITAYYPVGKPLGDWEVPYERGVDLTTLFERHALRELDNDQTRRIAGVEPAYGQCTREMLDLAKRRLDEDITLVGTVERFDDSVRLAAETLNWHHSVDYGRLNQSPAAVIDRELEQVISRHNGLDAELYQHAAKLLDDRVRQRAWRSHLGAS
jgi:hypothetical protein